MKSLPFTGKEWREGKTLYKQGGVRSILFSKGTYQAEVVEGEDLLWPFLQMDEEGHLLDCFCTCSEKRHCSHLAAAYLAIFNDKRAPLHKRYRDSFWKELCRIASKHHGYRADTVEKKKKRWEAREIDHKLIFSIRANDFEGENKIKEILEDRPKETEETSLKFSNLSEEEMSLWRSGRPSEALQFELSFWADLAKWMLALQESQESYRIEFYPKKEIPKWIEVSWKSMSCGFYLEKEDLEQLIPTLKSVQSPLKVYETQDVSIKKVEYDQKERRLILHPLAAVAKAETEKGLLVGDWSYVPGKGFWQKEPNPVFSVQEILPNTMESFLTKYATLVKNHSTESIHDGVVPLQYHLEFDQKENLQIETYLFSLGDLVKERSAVFGRWVYLEDRGFFYTEPPLFSSAKICIVKQEVADFIKRYKTWLNGIEGFHLHIASIESSVYYEVDEDGNLSFTSHIDIEEEEKEAIDLGDFIFISKRGFFPKRKEGELLGVWGGRKVAFAEVPFFIREHKKELETVPHFFSLTSPVEKVSLKIAWKDEGIHVKPIFSLHPSYETKNVLFFNEYTYVQGEGFCKIGGIPALVEPYLKERQLFEKEAVFFHKHTKEIEPWIAQMDPRLCAPKFIELELKEMAKEEGDLQKWKMGLSYKTDVGTVDVHTLWHAILEGKKQIFSQAGLLDLTSERFQWLRAVPKKKWTGKEKTLQMNALEWIRLQATEVVSLEPGTDEKAISTRKVFSDFQSCQGFLPLSKEGFQSQLRGYQETGLRWLWFLYCYGLSGILCDEMGLGKTHQAMGLLAAVFNSTKEKQKFLVVCPTSVIYHWQELLKNFLPSLNVYTFYGQGREVQKLENSYDVLLTSYGMVRSEKKHLEKICFAVGIYDELQQAKNPRSQIHRALRSLQVKMPVGLTGTPIENSLQDIKSLFDLVVPQYLPSDAYFKEHFIFPIEKEGDTYKKQMLAKMVRPFVLRRKKSEVLLELPAKVEEISYCDLSEEQRVLYMEAFSASQQGIRKEIEQNALSSAGLHIFALFSKLKQICDHPCLVNGDIEHFFNYPSGKWDLFVELLQEARESGQKVVVFTQYLKMMDIIKRYLGSQGIEYAEIRGSTRDRGEQLKKFKEDPDCEVFVASLQAAGVGIDLTAASVVIHYDRWWNPAKENQATDRVHRIGQSRGVQVFKLVTKRTIEERIHTLIEQKMGLLDEVVGFDDQFLIKHFTKQELMSLFSSLEEDCR